MDETNEKIELDLAWVDDFLQQSPVSELLKGMYIRRADGTIGTPTIAEMDKLWDNRQIRYDNLREVDNSGNYIDCDISTVFLVINHGTEDSPLLFETMIFGGRHSERCWRWSSEKNAIVGHEQIVVNLRHGIDPEINVIEQRRTR